MHPLAAVLRAAAAGCFPSVDGSVEVVPPYRDGIEAVVSFTAHVVAATSIGRSRLVAAGADGYGGASDVAVIALLAGTGGEVDSLDVLLVAPGTGHPTGASGSALRENPDLSEHPRVRYAGKWRADVRAYGDARGLVTLASGLAGLAELSFEVEPSSRGRGVGRELLTEGLRLVPHGEPVLAAVAPGNAASLRALLAAGFVPIGSVQLIRPGPALLR